MQKPRYQLVQGSGKGRECLCRAVLETKKKTRLIFTSGIAAIDRPAAEQYAALCALYNVLPAAPREKLLPEPYRAAWLNFKDHPPPVRPRPPPVAQQRPPAPGRRKAGRRRWAEQQQPACDSRWR